MIDETGSGASHEGARISWMWVAAFTVIASVAILLHSPIFSLSRVEVVGAIESNAVARVQESGVGPGAILLWVDTHEVRRAVESDPWVEFVTVERVWPNRLVVDVVERRPLAWIEGPSGWMRVGADGVVIDVADRPLPGLIHVAVSMPDREPGERPDDPTWHELVMLASVLEAGLGTDVRIDSRGPEIWTTLGEIEVRFGHPIDLADKGRTLLALLAEGLEPGSRVDVSSPHRPAIVPPEEPSVEVEG